MGTSNHFKSTTRNSQESSQNEDLIGILVGPTIVFGSANNNNTTNTDQQIILSASLDSNTQDNHQSITKGLENKNEKNLRQAASLELGENQETKDGEEV